eukprot:m.96500 g.96500  ORF g.96500 m.96500 type:complete len:342 (+) comp21988_c0_seq1:38-1063(+)
MDEKTRQYAREQETRDRECTSDEKKRSKVHIGLPHSLLLLLLKDDWTKRYENDCPQFYRLHSHTNTEIAQRIVDDEIHILFDLSGWSHGGRPEIIMLRPAPIIIQYAGFVGSSGLHAVDYILCDMVTCPPAFDTVFSEKIIRLPQALFTMPDLPPVRADSSAAIRAQYGLPTNTFIFCSLAKVWKIGPKRFALWLDILQQTQNTVIWLLRYPQDAADNILKHAKAAGMKNRFVFTEKMHREDYWTSAPKMCDLSLDTEFYNTITVAIEMLVGGLPLLTKPGRTLATRAASAIVLSAGLPELVVQTEADYVRTAVRLAEVLILGITKARLNAKKVSAKKVNF